MLLDLTVIYFAFGAPLGVYEITRNKRSPKTAALAAVHFLLWPLFAAASLRQSFGVHMPGRTLEQEIDDLRNEVEVTALAGRNSEDVLEFRDTFARYTGLAAASARTNGNASNELFSIAGHKDLKLASRCLERRDRRRLEFHLLQARDEFDAVVAQLAATHPRINEVGQRLDALLSSDH